MAKEKTGKAKEVPREIPNDYKILQELKQVNDNLREIRELLDNMWRERTP